MSVSNYAPSILPPLFLALVGGALPKFHLVIYMCHYCCVLLKWEFFVWVVERMFGGARKYLILI
jgi:hypothetical protein